MWRDKTCQNWVRPRWRFPKWEDSKPTIDNIFVYPLCFDYSRCFNLMEDGWKNMMLTCSFNEGLPCKSIAFYESHN
jgi:hypothetical protein